MQRNVDSLSTNFLQDYKTYPSDHTLESDTFWIGIKIDPKTSVILDIKWWHHDTKSNSAKDLEKLSFCHLGSPYSDTLKTEFEKACSGD